MCSIQNNYRQPSLYTVSLYTVHTLHDFQKNNLFISKVHTLHWKNSVKWIFVLIKFMFNFAPISLYTTFHKK